MQRRSLLLLSGAAALSAGAVVLLGSGGPPPPETGSAPLMFRDLATRLAAAARIEVERHDGRLSVIRQGEAWVLPEKAGYPARPEKAREVLVGLTELRLTEPRTSDPAMFERLGLRDPSREGSTASLLRVLDETGAVIAELVVGRRRVRTQGNVPESVYVRRPDEDQAWLAEGRLPLDADPQLWIDRDLASLPRERMLRAEVSRAGTAPVVLARSEGPDGRLVLVAPPDAPPTEQSSLDNVAGAFEFLTLTDVRREAEIPGSEAGEARFTLTDGLAIQVRLNQEGEAVWLRLAASGGGEAAALNARWRGWAYQVGAWKAKAFLPRLEDLRREEPARQEPARAPAP